MRQMVEEYKQKKQATEGEKKELELTLMVLDKEEKKKRFEADSARINERVNIDFLIQPFEMFYSSRTRE